jgi:8-oxo-dGTP diphosphatase
MYTYRYPRPAITVDALIYNRDNNSFYVLLIRRGQEPYRDKWALPGGFINMDELLEQACIRELREETGIITDKMNQFKTYDAIDRDPRGRTISVVFYAEVKEKRSPRAGDDAAMAGWFPVSGLPPLAFDHKVILEEFFRSIS